MTRLKRLEARSGADAPSQAAIKSRASVGAKLDALLAAIEQGDPLPEPEGTVECSPSPTVRIPKHTNCMRQDLQEGRRCLP